MIKRETFLPFSPPCIGEEEIAEVVDTLRSGWITTGPKTRSFESEFCEFVGAKDALALNSCTAGLHLALLGLGIGVGDEVIVPTMTFSASANVVEHVGADSVLIDICPETICIDPSKIEEKITSKTKAIIVVHFAGQSADLDPIMEIANRHGLFVIEDAAHAIPTKYKGHLIGSSNNLTVFSFYATKNITTGEGGMLTGPKNLVERIRVMSLHGLTQNAWKRFEKEGSWKYDIEKPGYKYNMTDIQAAMGRVQLRRVSEFHMRRKEIAETYDRAFLQFPEITVLKMADYGESAYHLYPIRVDFSKLSIDREQLFQELKMRNIGSSMHFIPLHTFTYYSKKYGYQDGDMPNALKYFNEALSLPLSGGLSHGDQDLVIDCLGEIFKKYRCL